MKARNKKVHQIKKQEQHPYQSGLANIGSVVQRLPVSKDLEDLVVEIQELAKVQTISVFEIGKRLVLARSEMHDKEEWKQFLEAVHLSNSLASRYIKAYETLHPLEDALGDIPASKLFELMYLDDVEEAVASGLLVDGVQKPIKDVTVKQIRAARKTKEKGSVSYRPFHETKKTSSVVSARIPSELSKQFQQLAHARHKSVSEYLVELIEQTITGQIIDADKQTKGREKE